MNSFEAEVEARILANGRSENLRRSANALMTETIRGGYSYNFSWLGRPIIQYPQDMVALQEIIWRVQPDLIVETGIAHGGSLIFSASMLELNAACGGSKDALVLGIDIDIRAHNRAAIDAHPLRRRIEMMEGSSIDGSVISAVAQLARGKRSVLVCLDSNHTHEHVLAELHAYGQLVTQGSYCVVFDTIIEDMPVELSGDRPWAPGNNPKSAVHEFLKTHPEFVVDSRIDKKLLISVAPGGYLQRVG